VNGSAAFRTIAKWTLPLALLLFSVTVLIYFISLENSGQRKTSANAFRQPAKTETAGPAAGSVQPKTAAFPAEAGMVEMARSGGLTLFADPQTGHFRVSDTETGSLWRSYPNPLDWSAEGVTDAWKNRMLSPFMISYIDKGASQNLDQTTDWYTENGSIAAFQPIQDGYAVTYRLDRLQLTVTAEVRLMDGVVETRIPQDGLSDASDSFSPVSLRLFPFFGAETSRQQGYLFIPDGSGALIDFREDRPNTVNYYYERVYGEDRALSFNQDASARLPVQWPVFGIRSEGKAFLAVIAQGAENAALLAAPSRAFNAYNWVTAEYLIRHKYFQPTSTARDKGVYVYSEEEINSERVTRYYLLSGGQPEYPEMAAAFRRYLTEEAGLGRMQREDDPIPLHLTLLGADKTAGFWRDKNLPLTTTEQALEIVKELNALGVDAMNVVYKGWERNGYSRYGARFPVNPAIGGNDGMERFTSYAHGKGYKVLLDAASYAYNGTGADGFRRSRDAIRDPGSTVIEATTETGRTAALVGPTWMRDQIVGDLATAARLGIDGLLFGEGDGMKPDSDFNRSRPVSRVQTIGLQREAITRATETLGTSAAMRGASYAADLVGHLEGLDADYSYDMFVSRTVPFVQIALHGLLTYSLEYANLSDDYRRLFLKGIEYGAEPSFLVTYAPTEELLRSSALASMYSTHYEQWQVEIVAMYQRYNEALGATQDAFIANHRRLAEGVYETAYDNGIRIVVNYNDTPYAADGLSVQPGNYTVLGGGGR